ncbi:MAG TPA: tRNA pseudouridine(54/55) synthase Pus10, partial [Candidatus Aenigmarchaeota archaeon]|nr:tRNA pseudouridine(54/55) synthase Pus10 [Candidatus Aenigmarchaeota archaeon]
MRLLEKVVEILKDGYVCDRCLGRQFSQLLSGLSNEERGRILRYYLAMLIDSGLEVKVNKTNFYGIKFHNRKVKVRKPKKCSVCLGIFDELKKKVKQIVKELKKYEFETFLIGCKLTPELVEREEKIWSKVGIEWCESIKAEINRELGKEIEKLTGKKMNRRMPDITVIVDLNTDSIELDVRSIFIYGKYQKLVRGIPQTKWKRKRYRTSVQEIIEKPLLRQTKAERSKFHGSGREDIEVRCLGWRPFVIELIRPKKRKIDLKKIREEINKSKKVKVKDLKFVGREIVRRVKFADHDKTYRAIVTFEKPLSNLERLRILKGRIIEQQTPIRVLRRRSDKIRKRVVKDLKYKLLGKKKVEFIIKAQAGLYIKELITGDEGRTKPSIAEILQNIPRKIE